jgi:MoaD family protein
MLTIHFASHLSRVLGTDRVEVEPERNLRHLLRALSRRYGAPFDERVKYCKIIVNGDNVAFLKGKSTVLKDGDTITILPPMAGG